MKIIALLLLIGCIKASDSDSDSSRSPGSSAVVEDFGINGCANPEHFTVVYDSFRHYETIVEGNSRATFLIGLDEIQSNPEIVAKIKDSNKKLALIYYVSFDKLVELNNIKNLNDLNAAVEDISRIFAEGTGWKLYHVMLPYGAPERIVEAFNRLKITVVSVALKYQKVKEASVVDFTGVTLIKTKPLDTLKSDFTGLKARMRQNALKPVSLFKCIPSGSVIDDENEPAPITSCQIDGTFTLLIKGGLEHYENVLLHDRNSAIVITMKDLNDRKALIGRALADQRELVVSLSERDLPSFGAARAVLNLILKILNSNNFNYLMISETVPRHFRQVFTLHPGVSVIRPQGRFIEAESEFYYFISPPFDFKNFVLVDLEEAGMPSKLLQTLETEMEKRECVPLTVSQCVVDSNDLRISSSEDQKRSIFRAEMNMLILNRRYLTLDVDRETIFKDSFDQLQNFQGDDLREINFSFRFKDEDGIDAGGLTKEWYSLLARHIFDPNYALFISSETNQNVFHPNPNSHANQNHLDYFKFVGLFIGKAIFDNMSIDCNFSRGLYKMMLGRKPSLYDLKEIDLPVYNSLLWMAYASVEKALDGHTFSVSTETYGEHREFELKPDGKNILITNDNKFEYISLMIQYTFYESCREQIDAFLQGFHEVIPSEKIASFTVGELKRLISGANEIDVDDWELNTEYSLGYSSQSEIIQWFWRAVRSMNSQEHRMLLSFVTGSTSVPSEGFSHLRSYNRICKFRISESFGDSQSLPQVHTCFNRIDLPQYPSYDLLREKLLLAINEGNGAFLLD